MCYTTLPSGTHQERMEISNNKRTTATHVPACAHVRKARIEEWKHKGKAVWMKKGCVKRIYGAFDPSERTLPGLQTRRTTMPTCSKWKCMNKKKIQFVCCSRGRKLAAGRHDFPARFAQVCVSAGVCTYPRLLLCALRMEYWIALAMECIITRTAYQCNTTNNYIRVQNALLIAYRLRLFTAAVICVI